MTALSPDGDRIALAGDALVLINLQNRERLELARPYWGVWGLSWSPNGDYITAHIHARIWLFDARSGTPLDKLEGGRPVGEVAWSPDSRRLVAPAPSDGTAIVWSIQEGGTADETQTLLGGEMDSPIEGLAFSHDGNAVMASDEGTAVKIWNLEPQDFEWASYDIRGIFWSDVEFMPDGKRVATNAYGKGGFVKVWDVASGRLVRTLGHDEHRPHRYKETSFDVSSDGELVAIMSGTEMRVWRVANGEEVLPMRREGVVSGGWSPDGDLFVAGGTDGVARIIDRSGSVVQTLQTGWDEGVHDARFSPDGRIVATTKNYEETLVWDWDRGEVISRIPDDGPWELAFDRTGSRVVSTNALWNTETGEQVMALPHDRGASRVAFSPDGSRFARASFDGGVGLFDAQTGEELFRLEDGCAIAGVDFSPDGSRLVTVGGCYTMKVWAADIDDLLELAHQRVTRALTDEECRQYLHLDRCVATS
jgi:WD40 repeat protein